jgi:phage terminase large subunit
MSFVYTTAIKKLRTLTKRIKGVPGGTSAGKTFGILPILINKAIKTPSLEVSVVSESIPHLKRGAIKDFKNIMISTNRWIEGSFNKTDSRYNFSNGSYIEFFSADQPDKLRGARRHILYINECNNVNFEAYQQLAIRTRDEVWLDFNPTHEFWYHTELKEDEDFEEVVLTYKDNEALSESIVKEIEKAKDKALTSDYWANWWNVYGLGQLGSLEGVIFSNWKQIQKVPEDARLVGIGLDFGYTNDPTAIVEIYKWNDKRIINELCYNTGMVNADIARILPRRTVIYADSAEPKSIEEIRRFGIDIRPVSKGKDSISFGIQVMQTQDYLVTETSTNVIKELRSYCWDVDKEGKTLNKPIDKFNHAIDAWRYHEMEDIGVKHHVFTF